MSTHPNFSTIETKISKRQFLSAVEYSALVTMLASIRKALTVVVCEKLRSIESYYFDLLISARSPRATPGKLEDRLITMNQFCYDSFGFGYWKFVD